MHDGKKQLVKEIAAERIGTLFGLARKIVGEDPELSHRYVSLMRRISGHYKVVLPAEVKMQVCKHCNRLLEPGVTAKVRLASSKGYLVYKCGRCGREVHTFYKRGKAVRS